MGALNGKALARHVTIGYLVLAAVAIAYELCIRLFNRGNSEFTGMLSGLLTLPSGLLVIAAGKVVGVNVGDSDVLFVVMLGLSALLNASIIWLILRTMGRSRAE